MKIIHSLTTCLAGAASCLPGVVRQSAAVVTGALLLGGVCQHAVAQQVVPPTVNMVPAGAAATTVMATGSGTGATIVAADAMATTALNAQKAAINARYGNTVRWGPVITTRVLRYDWLGRAYYQTIKTQSGSLGF